MHNTRKRVGLVLLAVAVLALLSWRLWPRSFAQMLHMEERAITGIRVSVSELGIRDGATFVDAYQLQPTAEDPAFSHLLSILAGTSYRPDFRNLCPFGLDSVDSGTGHITYSATVVLCRDGEDAGFAVLSFHSDSKLSVDLGSQAGSLVFHPVDRQVLTELADYLKAHGTPT